MDDSDEDDPVLRHRDGTVVDTWREGYPHQERLPREEYEHVKRWLQIELLKLQYWVQGSASSCCSKAGTRPARAARSRGSWSI